MTESSSLERMEKKENSTTKPSSLKLRHYKNHLRF